MAKSKNKGYHFHKSNDYLYHMGNGYVKPKELSSESLSSLYKEWNSILKKSGLVDIERQKNGYYSPYFYSHPQYKSSHHSAAEQSNARDEFLAHYYHMVSVYAECADLPTLFPGKTKAEYKLYYYLLRRHADGVTYRDLHKMVNRRERRNKRKKFTFTILFLLVKKLLAPMEAWHSLHPDGLIGPTEDDLDP